MIETRHGRFHWFIIEDEEGNLELVLYGEEDL
jgi:hypothetical protein